MSTILLEAEPRADVGKGASRRLRRLENKVPAVVYGGGKDAQSIYLFGNKVTKALESESIYSSVFDLKIGGKVEHVILKDLQRHPYKSIILHMDLQRVSAKDILVKLVPIHFVNEDSAKGLLAGGMVNHNMSQVEVRCEAQHLPEFIEVDVANLDLDEVIHLSQLKLPKGVHLAIEPEGDHDHPVVSVHLSKAAFAEEQEEAAEEEEATEESSEAESNEEPEAE